MLRQSSLLTTRLLRRGPLLALLPDCTHLLALRSTRLPGRLRPSPRRPGLFEVARPPLGLPQRLFDLTHDLPLLLGLLPCPLERLLSLLQRLRGLLEGVSALLLSRSGRRHALPGWPLTLLGRRLPPLLPLSHLLLRVSR